MNYLYGYGYGSEEQSEHPSDMILHQSTAPPPYEPGLGYHFSIPGYPALNQPLGNLNRALTTYHNYPPQVDVPCNPLSRGMLLPFDPHVSQNYIGPFFNGGDSLLRSMNDEPPSLSLASTAHTISLSTVEQCDITPPPNSGAIRYQDALILQHSGVVVNETTAQLVDLKLECVDDLSLAFPLSKVSLVCFLREEDQDDPALKTDFFTPYINSNTETTVDGDSHPRAFVNFGGAKVRLSWMGEEFLHIKLIEQNEGDEHQTGYIKLVFSSLQENVPMRVDFMNANGERNGFLILSCTLVDPQSASAKQEQKPDTRIMPNPVACEPSSHSTRPQARTFNAAKQKLAEEAWKSDRRQTSEGRSHLRQSRASRGFLSRFGRWCCELPTVDLN